MGTMEMKHIRHVLLAMSAAATTGNTALAVVGGNHLRGGHQKTDTPSNDIFSLALHDESLLLELGPRRRMEGSLNNDQQGNYVQECESFLFAEDVVDDGVISQTDFVEMLLHQCRLDDQCPNKKKLKFEQLDLSLQLKFIRGICHHEEFADRYDCIHNLNEMWLEGNEFGFQVTDDVDTLVHDMCFDTYVDAVGMGFASTSAPTVTPSTLPTPTPSISPTNAPSQQPSRAPTNKPSTDSPSMHPTSMPPTHFPTAKPSTISPITRYPSASPSSLPTPLSISTYPPSNGPTLPTRTHLPTARPSTASPTTLSPSISPSSPPVILDAPTDGPVDATVAQSSLPTLSPSNRPTSSQDTVASTPHLKRFADDCTSYLLSPDFLEDGIVSQTEFTQFLIHHCIQEGMCDDRTVISFEELEVSLQLEFVLGVCSHDEQAGKAQCIDGLKAMWRSGDEFGFDADVDDLELLVRDMCAMSYGYVLEMGLTGTPAPTELHTPSPSTAPPAKMMSNPPTVKFRSETPAPSLEKKTHLPSEIPSQAKKDGDDGIILEPHSSAPESEESISRGAIIGMASALALSLTAACIVYAHHRPCNSSRFSPDKYSSKDANHFGIAAHEPWGRSISSLPFSYMGPNCSISSSSSSFRDYRFVSVFGPEGTPIPQFNPNTAGAVVIGSVTIDASSSYSSGPFGNTGSFSAKSQSFFSLGKISPRRKDSPKSESGNSSKDDMSSLSSHRSAYQKNPRYRPSKHRHPKLDMHNRGKANIPIGAHRSTGSSQSKISRTTMPMSHRRRQKFERHANCNSHVSFGDWRAISYMTETALVGEGGTAASAAMQQSKFFFDTLLCPESTPLSSSDMTPKSLTCQSLPNMHYLARAGSSDAGASSILSESFFRDAASLIQQQSVTSSTGSVSSNRYGGEKMPSANHVFVPWRKEGFSSSLQLSDSKQSDDSLSSVESNDAPGPRIGLRSIRPAKALFAKFRKKTKAKDWFSFNHRQYHHLNKGNIALQEDSSVVSMKSYSSHVHLLPPHMAAARADLPNIVLGTFAAATMPVKQQKSHMMSPTQPKSIIVEYSSPPNNDEGKKRAAPVVSDVDSRHYPANDTAKSKEIQLKAVTARYSTEQTSRKATFHISSLDTIHSESFCAYSRSDFESSAPSKTGDWSDSSCDSNSTDSSQSNGHDVLECSFAAATAPLDGKQDTNMASSNVIEGCVDDEFFFSNGTNHFDANTTLDDESKAVHLIGISHILSESESSQGSVRGSVSLRSEENESSTSGHSNEITQDETHIISHSSSGSDHDDALFSYEETSNADTGSHPEDRAELFDNEECKMVFRNDSGQRGTSPQKTPEGKFVVISDDTYESPVLPVDKIEFVPHFEDEDCEKIFQGSNSEPQTIVLSPQKMISDEFQLPSVVSPVLTGLAVQKKTECVPLVEGEECEKEFPFIGCFGPEENDASTNVSSVNTWLGNTKEAEGIFDNLIAIEKGDGHDVLSISWEGEIASNSIGTIELDTSFASTIPIENHANE